MGWFDDAKKKAQETADDAREKAQEEAAKAALGAAAGVAKKTVGSFFEGIVSSAESSLEAAQQARGRTGEENPVLSGEVDIPEPATDDGKGFPISEPEIPAPTAEERALAELERLKGSRPVRRLDPEPDDVRVAGPLPDPGPAPPADPMAAAMAALEKARRARGAPDVEPPQAVRRHAGDPVAAALAAAAEARAHAQAGGSRALERERAAREQLEAMRGGLPATPSRGPAAGGGSSDEPDDDGPLGAPAPKKRSL